MDKLIYNQRDIPRDQYRYGFRTSADTGCGWIATYNVLRLMGYDTDIEKLIRYFEWQLPLLHGNTGTSFWGPALCLKQWGFPVKVLNDRRKYDAAIREADAAIIFYHWRKGCKLGAHFVALRREGDRFTGYNTFRNSTGPDDWGGSVERFLKDRGYFGTVLITVKKKQ